MKLGINSYTLMWSIGFQGVNPAYPDRAARPKKALTPVGLLDFASQHGVRLVQTGPNLGIDRLPATEVENFILTARERGIELELGTRGLDYEHLCSQVELAKHMNAKLIRTLPEIHGQYVADGKSIVPAVARILPVLEQEKVKLGIENGKIPASQLRAAFDEIDSPFAGVVLDMVNSLAVPEGWKEVTRILAPHVMCVHYKDFTIKRAWHMMGFICEGTPAGKGLVETKWLFDQLRVSRHSFNVIVELWPPEQPTVDETAALEPIWAEESIKYLRNFIRD
jgi:sugar phosphate isomerase/epimerase